jgi:hypothetical protein
MWKDTALSFVFASYYRRNIVPALGVIKNVKEKRIKLIL